MKNLNLAMIELVRKTPFSALIIRLLVISFVIYREVEYNS